MMDRKRANVDEISASRVETDRLRAEFDRVISLLSHNLHEPLRNVECYAELLKENGLNLDTVSRQHLDRIQDAVGRMRDIVHGITALAQLNSQKAKFERTDLSMVLRWLTVQMADTIQQRGARISQDPMPTVKGDPEIITQVMQHLLDNALKFTNSPNPTAHVMAQRDGPWVVVSVTDNGIGVAPAYREMCFEVFKRLNSRSNYPGEGIGLAYCRAAIERNGGRIWMEGATNGGTTIRFTLPAHEPES